MGEDRLDLSRGWCCNGKTWTEHAHESRDGECCQPQGKQIEDLPEDGPQKARERVAQTAT
jgi:hypothetical protein